MSMIGDYKPKQPLYSFKELIQLLDKATAEELDMIDSFLQADELRKYHFFTQCLILGALNVRRFVLQHEEVL